MGNKNSGNKPKAMPGELLELKQSVRVIMAKNPTSSDRDLVKIIAEDYPDMSKRNIKKIFDDIREERAKYIENIEAPQIVAETVGLLQMLESFLIDMIADETLPAGVRSYCAMNVSLVRKQMITTLLDTGMLAQAPKPIVIDGLDLNEIFNSKERGEPSIMSTYQKKIETIFIKAGLKPKNELRRIDRDGIKSLESG